MADNAEEPPEYKFAPGTRHQFLIAVLVISSIITVASGAVRIGSNQGTLTVLLTIAALMIPGYGAAYLFYLLGRRDAEWWLRYTLGQEKVPPPKRVQRRLWEAKRAAGEDPGPEPLDPKSLLKVLAATTIATFFGVVPVGFGWYLSDGLGWGGSGFVLGLIVALGSYFIVAASAGWLRQRARSRQR